VRVPSALGVKVTSIPQRPCVEPAAAQFPGGFIVKSDELGPVIHMPPIRDCDPLDFAIETARCFGGLVAPTIPNTSSGKLKYDMR